jgi:hypothetical protein
LGLESSAEAESISGDGTDTENGEDFISRIENVTRSLRDRAIHLKDEEAEYALAAEKLLDTQERLIEQMDQLMVAFDTPQAETENSENSDDPPHAIAG